jgi:3-hydroxyisobutyrate dehydrogenase
MALGYKYEIDEKVLWECMTDGTANSWVMGLEQPVPGLAAEAPSSHGYRRAFGSHLSLKDLGIAIRSAEKVGLDAAVGKVAIEAFRPVTDDSRNRASIVFTYPLTSFAWLTDVSQNLDHISLWLHVNDTVNAFIKKIGVWPGGTP